MCILPKFNDNSELYVSINTLDASIQFWVWHFIDQEWIRANILVKQMVLVRFKLADPIKNQSTVSLNNIFQKVSPKCIFNTHLRTFTKAFCYVSPHNFIWIEKPQCFIWEVSRCVGEIYSDVNDVSKWRCILIFLWLLSTGGKSINRIDLKWLPNLLWILLYALEVQCTF